MKLKIFTLTALVAMLLVTVTPVLAQDFDFSQQESQNAAFLAESGLGTTPLAEIIGEIIKIFLSFLGVIFVVLIIYAGFMWMTAAGNDDKISKAKTTLTAAIIGLAIILAAYAITYFVIDQVIEATKGGHGLD